MIFLGLPVLVIWKGEGNQYERGHFTEGISRVSRISLLFHSFRLWSLEAHPEPWIQQWNRQHSDTLGTSARAVLLEGLMCLQLGNSSGCGIYGVPTESTVNRRGRERKGPPEIIQKFRLRKWPISSADFPMTPMEGTEHHFGLLGERRILGPYPAAPSSPGPFVLPLTEWCCSCRCCCWCCWWGRCN